ncbi:hypothetical protein ACFE04_024137 [Oxalis oulophora]
MLASHVIDHFGCYNADAQGSQTTRSVGRSFAKVTIHDQPLSNTIQKIIALKDVMRYVENYLQSLNVTLLKIRSIMLSGHPQLSLFYTIASFSMADRFLIGTGPTIMAASAIVVRVHGVLSESTLCRKFRSFKQWKKAHEKQGQVMVQYEKARNEGDDETINKARGAVENQVKKIETWQQIQNAIRLYEEVKA